MEDYAWIIDYLPEGKANDPHKQPLVLMIGHMNFTLLEATVKPNVKIIIGSKVFIGKGERKEIERVRGKIKYSELTQTAKDNLPNVLRNIVHEREKDFVNFINKATSLSIRVHQLELLPGIGKKHLEAILTEREKREFTSFADVRERIPSFPDPALPFVHKILNELEGKERINFFVKF